MPRIGQSSLLARSAAQSGCFTGNHPSGFPGLGRFTTAACALEPPHAEANAPRVAPPTSARPLALPRCRAPPDRAAPTPRAPPSATASGRAHPGARSPPAGHPARGSPTAHSAVVAGAPNPRATTSSNSPRNSWSLASSSARPHATDTRSARSSAPTADSRKEQRRRLASSRTPVAVGHNASRIRPGTPAPEPRSRNRPWKSGSTAAASASAWSRCASTGPGPTIPRRRASSSCAVS